MPFLFNHILHALIHPINTRLISVLSRHGWTCLWKGLTCPTPWGLTFKEQREKINRSLQLRGCGRPGLFLRQGWERRQLRDVPSNQLGSSREGSEGHSSCFSLGPDTRTHCFIRQKCLDFTVSIYSKKFMQCECLSDQRGWGSWVEQ